MKLLRRLLLTCLLAAPAFALDNQLAGHPSPYLALHGGDPVAWQDWGPAPVERARQEGKLLFVSSGYFSCHWCHVMQRESFQNAQIAALLNTHFVPVKIDRELHAALDAHLIDFVDNTQGHAGWPLNVFLTPEGYPLLGATYLPPERFLELLQRLHAAWTDERGKLRNMARRGLLQLTLERAQGEVAAQPLPVLLQGLLDQTLSVADVMEGGFGEQNKFPMEPQLLALLDLHAAAPHPQLAEFLTLTLDKLAHQGMRDQLAGGFFRYTVDPSWHIPHFEKMLYNQALLAEVFLRAGQIFGREDYAAVARDTLEFVVREMRGVQGAYVASFSAVDGQGEEGGVYLWSVHQLHEVLGEQDTALARRHWAMQDLSPFDGGHLPRRGESAEQIAQRLEQPRALVEARLADIRGRLLEARAQRVLPVDTKELTAWNGLLLAALAQAAVAWDAPRLESAARQVRDWLRDRMWDGNSLRRALADGRELGKAALEDYAYAAYGMSHFADLSRDPADRTFAVALMHAAWQRFYGPAGWRQDDEPLIPGMGEVPAMVEGALPAPSAVLIRLSLDSGDPALQALATEAAERGRAQAQQEPFWYAGHHAALLRLQAEPMQAGADQ
jgi:uncharacterized protein YyaL (SSP411 family)